jgi:hypothetical protein
MSESRTNGSQSPQAQQQPNLSVLSQYVKDLSFENSGAPQSLRGRQTAPTINISINVQSHVCMIDRHRDELVQDPTPIDPAHSSRPEDVGAGPRGNARPWERQGDPPARFPAQLTRANLL